MKKIKSGVVLLLVLFLNFGCSEYDEKVKQKVRVRLKNNTEKTINLWTNGEAMGWSNLVSPQSMREVVVTLTFTVSGGQWATPVDLYLNAGFQGAELNTNTISVDYWPEYDTKERLIQSQFNSDGSFSGF